MRKLLRPSLLILPSLLIPLSLLFGYTIDEKLKLEQVFAERVTGVLENIAGKGKIFAVIDATLDTEINRPNEGEAPEHGESAEKVKKYYLPGYPSVMVDAGDSKDNPNITDARHIVTDFNGANMVITIPQTMIRKLSVTVFVDVTVPDKIVEYVPGVVAGMLGMDRQRGDQINMQRVVVGPEAKPTLLEQMRKPEYVFDGAKFVIIVALILLELFVGILFMRYFLRYFSDIAGAYKTVMIAGAGRQQRPGLEGAEADTGPAGELSPAEQQRLASTDADKKTLSGPSGEAPREEQPHFSFINDKNLYRLYYLLRNEEPEKIAMALSFLPHKSAAYVMAKLPPEKRALVTNRLASIFQTEPEHVVSLEQSVKDKIDYVLGGEELISGVIDFADEDIRECLLQDISRQNPQYAEDLKSRIFLFESIGFLSDKELQLLLNRLDTKELAIALHGDKHGITERVMANKTEGGRTMLRQTMDMFGQVAEPRVRAARQNIVSIARQMIREGFIVPRKVKKVEAYVVE